MQLMQVRSIPRVCVVVCGLQSKWNIFFPLSLNRFLKRSCSYTLRRLQTRSQTAFSMAPMVHCLLCTAFPCHNSPACLPGCTLNSRFLYSQVPVCVVSVWLRYIRVSSPCLTACCKTLTGLSSSLGLPLNTTCSPSKEADVLYLHSPQKHRELNFDLGTPSSSIPVRIRTKLPIMVKLRIPYVFDFLVDYKHHSSHLCYSDVTSACFRGQPEVLNHSSQWEADHANLPPALAW